MSDTHTQLLEPATAYTNTNGKTVYRYELEAASLRDALDQIPGDFLLYWWNQDRRTFFIEIVRTF